MLFQFKIQLEGITEPEVWRRVVVPADFTFYHFHLVIQAAFGWENDHLYFFSKKGYRSRPIISESSRWDEADMEADETELKTIFKRVRQTYTYLYDFGDDWIHKITLEKKLPEESSEASCVAGEGQCPPEDCGGPMRYEYMKHVLKNPEHEAYDDMREWLWMEDDEEWDANEFDLEEADLYVREV